MKKVLSFIVCLVLCLGVFAGCVKDGGNIPDPSDTGDVSDDTATDTGDDTTESAATDTNGDNTENTTENTTGVPDPEVDVSASLTSLRQAMIETPELFSAAYIGLTDTVDPVDPMTWIKKKAPQLCEDLPFITAIPDENIIGDRYGELYCIVPADPDATLSVNLIDHEGVSKQVLYRSESGDPVLLFCNQGGFVPDTEVFITDSEGRNIVWYPQLDDEGYLYECYDLDGNLAVNDFTPYSERLNGEYEYYLNEAGFWKHPEEMDIANTSWECTDYLMDGTERVYYLDILENTVNISWNDGIDEENHVYNDAPWKLKYVDGAAVMEIDLGNLDGIRNFIVLITTEHNLMYFTQDFVNEDIRNYEKLSRTLERTFG